jgi:large subunit ribosomal protein L18
MKTISKKQARQRRHARTRRTIRGTAERPRAAVMVSNQHIYVQFIDDDKGATLAAATTAGKSGVGAKNVAGAKQLGLAAAEKAKAAGIKAVVFDRGGYRYHGRVKAVADALREAGLAL